MLKKYFLRRDIKRCQREIELLEQRRTRSQAALIEAILTQTTPGDEDADYFNRFTQQIEYQRAKMHELKSELDKLEK